MWKRNKITKRLYVCLLLCVFLSGLTACADKEASAQLLAMDTVMSFTAFGANSQEAIEVSNETVRTLENLLSPTRTDSELYHLNQSDGEEMTVTEVVGTLLETAVQYDRLTDGAFDCTIAPVSALWGFTSDTQRVPSESQLAQATALVDSQSIEFQKNEHSLYTVRLGRGQAVDLGGIAKGYVSDQIEAIYEELEIESGAVSLGGNVYVRGTKPDDTLWNVGIQDPNHPNGETLVGVLELRDAFAVTSGGYQRYFEQDGAVYHHILNPETGYPAENNLTSVTVIAPANGQTSHLPGHGTMCDALSTALFVMGEEEALDFWRESDLEFELVLVTQDGRVLVTAGMGSVFTPLQEGVYHYETVS